MDVRTEGLKLVAACRLGWAASHQMTTTFSSSLEEAFIRLKITAAINYSTQLTLAALIVWVWGAGVWLTQRTGGKWVQLLLVSQISRWCSSNQGYFQICVLMISSLYECSVSANTSHMISCMRTSFILLLFSTWICKFKGCKYDYSNKISSHRVE